MSVDKFTPGVVHTAPHLLADLAELVVLLEKGQWRSVSKSDIRTIALREMPYDSEVIDEQELQIQATNRNEYDPEAELLEDCWTQLEYRAGEFANCYPFKVQGSELCFEKRGPMKKRDMLYAFLLICSRLKSFSGSGVKSGFVQRAAGAFVSVCRQVLVELSSVKAEVRIFDAHSSDRKSYYGNKLKDAIKILAKDMCAMSLNHAIIDDIDDRDSGDEGIDLVSIDGLGRSSSGSIVILAQCAARETGWPQKRLEGHPITIDRIIITQSSPLHILFTPVCYHAANGSWVDSGSTTGTVVIDRVRIVSILGRNWHRNWKAIGQHVDDVLNELDL